MWITDWTARAACKGTDPDELFVQGAAQNRAKLICRGCPVRTECLADALDNRIEFGVWGGMTERERRALLRRRPDVTSWRDLLETARNKYERTGDELGVGKLVGGDALVLVPGALQELAPRHDVGPAPEQRAPLPLGHAAPHPELDPVVERVREALGPNRAAAADQFGPVLRCPLNE